jgi:hypothetical protein
MVAASSAPWSRRDIVPPSLELAKPRRQYGDDDRPQPVDARPAQRGSLRSSPHSCAAAEQGHVAPEGLRRELHTLRHGEIGAHVSARSSTVSPNFTAYTPARITSPAFSARTWMPSTRPVKRCAILTSPTGVEVFTLARGTCSSSTTRYSRRGSNRDGEHGKRRRSGTGQSRSTCSSWRRLPRAR